jgi:hypothetical protein
MLYPEPRLIYISNQRKMLSEKLKFLLGACEALQLGQSEDVSFLVLRSSDHTLSLSRTLVSS